MHCGDITFIFVKQRFFSFLSDSSTQRVILYLQFRYSRKCVTLDLYRSSIRLFFNTIN